MLQFTLDCYVNLILWDLPFLKWLWVLIIMEHFDVLKLSLLFQFSVVFQWQETVAELEKLSWQ